MEPKQVFKVMTPNGVEITAVAVDFISQNYIEDLDPVVINYYLCYSQNRLFTVEEFVTQSWDVELNEADVPVNVVEMVTTEIKYDKIVVDYVVLPEYDQILELSQVDPEEGRILC